MPKAIKITSALLEQMGVCGRQLNIFKATFPNGTNLNKHNILKAIKNNLSVDEFFIDFLKMKTYEVHTDKFFYNSQDGTKKSIPYALDYIERHQKKLEKLIKQYERSTKDIIKH